MGIIFALLSAVFVAFSAYFIKKSLKSFSISLTFFIFSIFCLIFWVPIAFGYFGVEQDQIIRGLFYGFLSATLAQTVYHYVLTKGELGITGTVLSSYPIYTVAFSLLFLGENLTNAQFLMIGLTIFGTFIVSLPQKISKNDINNLTYIIWPIIGAASVGLSDTISKNFIDTSGVGTFLLGTAIMQVPVSFVFMVLMKQDFREIKDVVKNLAKYKLSLLGALLGSFGTMFIFLSFDQIQASIASPITGSVPIFLLFLTTVFLKEKLSLKDIIGVFFVIVGIIGIGIV